MSELLFGPQFLFQINVFCGSRAEVVLRPIFVTWLCRECIGTRGLISLNFYAFVLFNMYFVAPEQNLFYGQFLLPDSVERVLEPGA